MDTRHATRKSEDAITDETVIARLVYYICHTAKPASRAEKVGTHDSTETFLDEHCVCSLPWPSSRVEMLERSLGFL